MPPAKKKAKKSSVPPGWIMSGANPQEFDASIDYSIFHSGTKSAFLTHNESITGPYSWGTLMQQMNATPYVQSRLKMSVWIKTKDVKQSVHAWLRVDGPDKDESSLSFDNMCDRPIKKLSDWTKFSIVLDVPAESTNIAFGVYLMGKGRVWIDDFSFDKVDSNTPTTDCPCSRNRKSGAKNLNFESDD